MHNYPLPRSLLYHQPQCNIILYFPCFIEGSFLVYFKPIHADICVQDQKQPQNIIAGVIKESAESKIAYQSLKGSAHRLTKEQEAVRKKHNLNKWKYAELRDTINTSVGMFVCYNNYLSGVYNS